MSGILNGSEGGATSSSSSSTSGGGGGVTSSSACRADLTLSIHSLALFNRSSLSAVEAALDESSAPEAPSDALGSLAMEFQIRATKREYSIRFHYLGPLSKLLLLLAVFFSFSFRFLESSSVIDGRFLASSSEEGRFLSPPLLPASLCFPCSDLLLLLLRRWLSSLDRRLVFLSL